ncbi:MAG TPA: S8 family peptidase [Devosiaceae bacterium]
MIIRPKTHPLLGLLAAAGLTMLLAACGGSTSSGGGGGGSGGTLAGGGSAVDCGAPGSATGGPSWYGFSMAGSFDSACATQLRNSAEYQNADARITSLSSVASPGYGTKGAGSQSNPYDLIHLDQALSTGLTGAGKTVAVMDDGFLTSHQELVGRIAGSFGTVSVADHGTHVASIIAGNKDGVGMHGVAPGASLYLSSYTGEDLQWMADATNAAATAGAIAQNNSWGWNASTLSNPNASVTIADIEDYMTANPGATYIQALSAVVGYSTTAWNNYFAALGNFEKSGVVVFAASNDETATSADVASSMPYFDSALASAWITGINGYFEVDGSGAITYAQRLSAPCAQMAELCIAADGTTTGATSSGTDQYDTGTGTSFVAPQISGAVALVSEAFPSLSPSELANRLLASADNSWFSRLGIAKSGTVDFGNGISHDYSSEWGMGTLDLAAALSPIGTLSITSSGASVYTAPRTPLSSAGIVAPAAYGDGLKTALSGRDMAAFDALNANFTINAGDLVGSGGISMIGRLSKIVPVVAPDGIAGLTGGINAPNALAFSTTTSAGLTARMALTDDVGGFTHTPGAGAGSGSDASILSLADGALAAEASQQIGGLGLSVFAFTGGHANLDRGAVEGAGAKLSLAAGAGTIDIGVSQIAERGALLGLSGNSAFGFGSAGSLGAIDVGFEQALTPRLSIFGNAEYGVASAQGATTGLVSGMSSVGFSGFTIGAGLSDLAAAGDRLTIAATQPLRVETGAIALQLPVGRDQAGNIFYDSVNADLTPSGREIDLSLGYDLPVEEATRLRLGMSYAIDAGHVRGATAFGVAAAYSHRF